MKKVSKMYYILTYMFFLYPPFIWGLVSIYNNSSELKDHILTLIINIILIICLIGGVAFAIIKETLHFPKKIEQKHLIFGLLSNIVVYFYTFQNALNISNLVTVYLLLMIVLMMYSLLISKQIKPLELWILLPLFIIIDYIHLAITGCGWTDYSCSSVSQSGTVVAIILYYLIILSIYFYYTKQIIMYNLFKPFKIIHIGIGTVIVFLFQMINDLGTTAEKLLMTLLIALVFIMVVDFIVSIVNKTYTHKMTLFYIRTLTLIAFGALIGATELLTNPSVEKEFLVVMVAATYVSLGINILKPLLGVYVDDSFTHKHSSMAPYQFKEESFDDVTQVTMKKKDLEIGLYTYKIIDFPNKEHHQINIVSFDLPEEVSDQHQLLNHLEHRLNDKGSYIVFESINFDASLDSLLTEIGFDRIYHQETELITYLQKKS
ncbi:MAG: hypothetical protein K9L26_03640 [Candidatus Izimaplasma sp.]|nr:hypothetical protein [Candidatus Izimaplasma bacterium]